MPRWIAILIVLLFFQNDALANDADQCAAGNGIYLSGVVTTLPVFSHGRVLRSVELSHTHISMKASQDGRTYDVAMDNLFARGYDQQRNGVPPPLDQLHIGDPYLPVRRPLHQRYWRALGALELRPHADHAGAERLGQDHCKRRHGKPESGGKHRVLFLVLQMTLTLIIADKPGKTLFGALIAFPIVGRGDVIDMPRALFDRRKKTVPYAA